MPDSIVQIEGVGNVQFPSSMSEQDIGQAAHKLYTGAGAQKIEATPPGVPRPPNSISQGIEENKFAPAAGLPGGSTIMHEPSDRELAVRSIPAGVAALGMAPTLTGIAAKAMRAHPILTTMGLTAAQQIPGTIGRIASKIPSWLPLLAGEGRAGGAAAGAEAEGVAAKTAQTPEEMQSWWRGRGGTVAGDRPIARAPRPQPSVPEEGGSINIPPPTSPAQAKPTLSLPHGQYEAPASPIPPQKALGEGVLEGEYMDGPPPPPPTIRGNLPRGQYAAPASTLPPPKQLGEGAPPPRSEWPPAEPTPRFQIPRPSAKISPRADLLEDQGVKQGMDEYLDRQGKEVYAKEPLGKSKGELIDEARQAQGQPPLPVKLTKTPSAAKVSPKTVSGYEYKGGQFLKNGKVLDKGEDIADALKELNQDDYFGGPTIEGRMSTARPSSASRKSAVASPKDADLTPEWQAELDRVKAQKAKKSGR